MPPVMGTVRASKIRCEGEQIDPTLPRCPTWQGRIPAWAGGQGAVAQRPPLLQVEAPLQGRERVPGTETSALTPFAGRGLSFR